MNAELHVTMTLRAPLVHGAFGASVGNATPIRRLSVVSLPGMPRIPVVSGNALRGRLRRLVFRDIFERAGLGPKTMPSPQWDKLYAACANGGHLTGSETTYRPDTVAELRTELPPLSIFGAALYTWMLPGRMSIGFAWPACRETVDAGLVPAPDGHPLRLAEELVEEVSLVRHVDRTEQDPEVSGVTPMPTTIETLATGTVLWAKLVFSPGCTPQERGCILHGLDLLNSLGAKASAGFGEVCVARAGVDSTDLDAYRTWLTVAPIREALTKLSEKLAGAGAEKPAKAQRKGKRQPLGEIPEEPQQEPDPQPVMDFFAAVDDLKGD